MGTVKRRGICVPAFLPTTIPEYIMENHKVNTICADNIYVDGNVFFNTITRNMKFRLVVHANIRHKVVLPRETKAVLNMYKSRNFSITSIHVDK